MSRPPDAQPLDNATPPATGRAFKPRPPTPWYRRPAGIFALVVGTLALLVVAALFVGGGPPRSAAYRIKCASNLRQIGRAMRHYASENGGQYPDELNALLRTQDLSPRVFVCPASTDKPAIGASRAQQASNLLSGGHLSYVYCGRGRSPIGPAGEILAFDADGYDGQNNSPGATPDGGREFLYADGHAAHLDAAEAGRVINELAAGFNPPRP